MDAEAYITNFYEGRDYLQLSEEAKQVLALYPTGSRVRTSDGVIYMLPDATHHFEYEIDLHELKEGEGILRWLEHLQRKDWFDTAMKIDFLLAIVSSGILLK
jgi:hypothetical protein